MEASLIFPHQLFEDNPCIYRTRTVYLVEDHLYFLQFKFHKQKLILHRASLRFYRNHLLKKGYKVEYIEAHKHKSLEDIFIQLQKHSTTAIHYCDTVDYLLERRIERFSERYAIKLIKHKTPSFVIDKKDFSEVFVEGQKYFMASFYIEQRKRLNILVNNGQPIGGKWSFDTENRKKLPAKLIAPPPLQFKENEFVKEAKQYVETKFANNYGKANSFNYPVTFKEARQALEDFLVHRMKLFGDYEDAIVSNQSTLFHSVLTPALNTGLLTPSQVLDITFTFHDKYNFPLNSLEGFVRQIIGWREFMRGLYEREGVYQRTRNFFEYKRNIPANFWKGETGIVPIDFTINKVLENAYCHHIERLMVLGNFMFLCEFNPDAVYQWFMELFIDAYDWVMVPNVYGMSQYADGGLMSTKPYVSGSNYLLKMSNYKKGDWSNVWDSLYWRFIYKNRDWLKENQRMNMIIALLQKMDKKKLKNHLSISEQFLNSLK